HTAADDPVGAQHASLDIGNMHAAALATAISGRLAHEFSGHPVYIQAKGNRMAMRAVRSGDDITFLSMAQRAHRTRFLAHTKMSRPVHSAFGVELVDLF